MTILDRIASYKRLEIEAAKARLPLAAMQRAAAEAPPVRPFLEAIEARLQRSETALIAEIKKASPSKGLIRDAFNPPDLARAYESGGAACLSILTDTPSFQGQRQDLIDARSASSLPCLRKDFLFDPYQVYEARSWGADCILIILAAVTDSEAYEIENASIDCGLDAILEVHDEEELRRALRLRSRLIGINNRDLKSFATSLSVSERLAPLVPKTHIVVGESGIATPDDVARLAACGIHTLLVGESLMRQDDVEGATRALLARTGS
ncbi:MAG: indole-3-glycerol phosphate synthase TrpC [Alphaproteobacteria bacterium]|nr:indole-3-glycerol phosphate synthase TrpC [Alphaproteobacteria bacterium]